MPGLVAMATAHPPPWRPAGSPGWADSGQRDPGIATLQNLPPWNDVMPTSQSLMILMPTSKDAFHFYLKADISHQWTWCSIPNIHQKKLQILSPNLYVSLGYFCCYNLNQKNMNAAPIWAVSYKHNTELILGLYPANERRRYFVTTSLIGWVQT